MKAQRENRGTVLLFLQPRHEWGWAVNTTPRPIYHGEWHGIHFTGGWV